MKITGRIAKMPMIKEKVIFSAIKESEEQKPIQIVLFKQSRPIILTKMLSELKSNDVVTITGKLERNPRNNETQIIIDDIELDYKEVTCPESF